MEKAPIESGLAKFKNDLLELRSILEVDLVELEEKENELDRTYNIDMEYLRTNLPKAITLNIGGEVFKTSKETILSNKQSLFFFVILRTNMQELKANDFNLYFDISPRNFEHILNFMKYKFCDLANLTLEEHKELLVTAKYFELSEMAEFIEDRYLNVEIVDYTTNGPYFLNYGMTIVGELDPKVLNSMDNRGLTATNPGHFVFELSKEIYFDTISCIGFTTNTSFSSSNGSGSTVYTSLDGKDFKYVGKIGTISNILSSHKVSLSKARYVKFENTSYLGFSYVEIIQARKNK